MSSIAPFRPPVLSPSNAAPTLGAATAATSASGSTVPAAIIQLGAGTVISGVVLEKGARGQVVVRTDKGTLTIQTPLALRVGATLTLQLQSVGAQVQLTILSVDGEALAPGRTPQQLPATDSAAAGRAPASSTTSSPAVSISSSSTSAPPGPATAAAPAQGDHPTTEHAAATGLGARPPGAMPADLARSAEAAPSLRPGAVLSGTILGGSTPADPAATLAKTGQSPIPTPATAAAPSSTGLQIPTLRSASSISASMPVPPAPTAAMAPLSGVPAPALPSAGTAAVPVSIQLRVLGLASPVSATPAPPQASAPTAAGTTSPLPRIAAEIPAHGDAITLMAIVEPSSADDQPGTVLLRTSLGLIRAAVPTPVRVPAGTGLLLEVLPSTDAEGRPVPLSADSPDEMPRRLLALSQDWPALREATVALQANDPTAAQRMLAAAIPRVGPNLAAGLLFFIAAMRNGDTRAWIGDRAADALDRAGHGALLSRLADDVNLMPRLAESQPNGWQTLVIPLFDGERLQQIRMYMRRGRKDSQGDRREGARFILEADLSKLGPLQLDGLVHPPQFDLAIRTRENLPATIRTDILQIFNDAMQATKLQGSVSFHTSRSIRPGPFEDWHGSALGLMV